MVETVLKFSEINKIVKQIVLNVQYVWDNFVCSGKINDQLPLLCVDLLQAVHLETKVRMVNAPMDVVIHSTSLSKQTMEMCCKEGCNHLVWKECLFV